MYEQKHIDISRRFTSDRGLPTDNVAFYGDKVVATDSYRLVEILASGEHHEPLLFPAKMLKAVKIPKGFKQKEEDFGITQIEGEKFPDYMQLKVNWEKEDYIEFAVNGDYLAEIASQFAKLSPHKKVILHIPKIYMTKDGGFTNAPIKIKAPDATAYLMPMENKK